MENIMQAGFACVDITPYMGLNLQGYYHARYATGIEDRLCLRAAAFAFGDEKAIIFNCEAIDMKAVAYDVIKKKVAAACGISEDAIYINCVHTHTAFRFYDAEVGECSRHACRVGIVGVDDKRVVIGAFQLRTVV